MGEGADGLIGVCHCENNSVIFEAGHLVASGVGFTMSSELEVELSWFGGLELESVVLVSGGMAGDNDGAGPSSDKLFNVFADNWLVKLSSLWVLGYYRRMNLREGCP